MNSYCILFFSHFSFHLSHHHHHAFIFYIIICISVNCKTTKERTINRWHTHTHTHAFYFKLNNTCCKTEYFNIQFNSRVSLTLTYFNICILFYATIGFVLHIFLFLYSNSNVNIIFNAKDRERRDIKKNDWIDFTNRCIEITYIRNEIGKLSFIYQLCNSWKIDWKRLASFVWRKMEKIWNRWKYLRNLNASMINDDGISNKTRQIKLFKKNDIDFILRKFNNCKLRVFPSEVIHLIL